MIGAFRRIYRHDVKTRLSKALGMELHKEEFDVLSNDVTKYYADFS